MKQQTLTSSFKQKEMDEVIKIVNEIKTTLYSEIDEMINDIFNSLIIDFKNQSSKINSTNEELIDSKNKFITILNKL